MKPDFEKERFQEIKEQIDNLCDEIKTQSISPEEAKSRAEDLRLEAAIAFPDKLELYDMIYSSRLERLMEQFLK